jgi:hypothetical protein
MVPGRMFVVLVHSNFVFFCELLNLIYNLTNNCGFSTVTFMSHVDEKFSRWLIVLDMSIGKKKIPRKKNSPQMKNNS